MNIRKITALFLAGVLLFAVSGCGQNAEIKSLTLDELKEAAGGVFLYPDALPEAFEPETSAAQGIYYGGGKTWDYYINLQSVYARDLSTEHFWRLNEGESAVAIAWITVRTYGPEHGNTSVFSKSRKSEMEKYENLAADGEVWEIDGVITARETEFWKHETGYLYNGSDEEEKYKRENVSPEYYDYNAYALFIHDEVLYAIDFKAYGRGGDSENEILELCGGLLGEFIGGMIKGVNGE